MTENTANKSSEAVADLVKANRALLPFFLFSSTLLSTMQPNKLLHLILSALVHDGNGLFDRAMLFLHNNKTNILQGMLGICSKDAAELRVVDAEPENSLTGFWELDKSVISRQWQADFCVKVRDTRIDLADGCTIINSVVRDRRLYRSNELCCPDVTACCSFIDKFDIRTFAVVPLVTRSKVLGIIIVDNPVDNRQISGEQLQMLQLFANQAGMAIENSQLYRNLEEAHSELRETRQRLLHGAHLAAIGEMAASISHELKTPLITIGGFAARLGRMMPEDTQQRHYLDTIISESHRLERLLGDILAFSRKPTICYVKCDLRSVLAECVEDYRIPMSERGIQLESNLAAGHWFVIGDGCQLKQVFINLMVNAQEAMSGGGRLKIELSLASSKGRPRAEVTVSDTGGGVPDDILDKVFTPFFTTKHHGTGLGLAIVNRIVQNHGGAMHVSNNDEGAEFRILLPLAHIETEGLVKG